MLGVRRRSFRFFPRSYTCISPTCVPACVCVRVNTFHSTFNGVPTSSSSSSSFHSCQELEIRLTIFGLVHTHTRARRHTHTHTFYAVDFMPSSHAIIHVIHTLSRAHEHTNDGDLFVVVLLHPRYPVYNTAVRRQLSPFCICVLADLSRRPTDTRKGVSHLVRFSAMRALPNIIQQHAHTQGGRSRTVAPPNGNNADCDSRAKLTTCACNGRSRCVQKLDLHHLQFSVRRIAMKSDTTARGWQRSAF